MSTHLCLYCIWWIFNWLAEDFLIKVISDLGLQVILKMRLGKFRPKIVKYWWLNYG